MVGGGEEVATVSVIPEFFYELERRKKYPESQLVLINTFSIIFTRSRVAVSAPGMTKYISYVQNNTKKKNLAKHIFNIDGFVGYCFGNLAT